MTARMETTKDGIRESLAGMLNRTNAMSAFLQRVIYPEYIRAQERRWETENASEGATWIPLQSAYATYKKTKYASFPGSGEKTMIATGKLSFAATGRSRDGYKLITNTSFVVGISDEAIPYGKYAAEHRPIMKFSDDTVNYWKSQIAGFVVRGKS